MVSLKHIQNVGDDHLLLTNSVSLPYSRRKKAAILQAFRENLSMRALSHDTISWKMDLAGEFGCFTRCPFPFFILEIESGSHPGELVSFYLRWANDALASLTRTALHKLIHAPLPSFFFTDNKKALDTINRIALSGGTAEWFDTPLYSERKLHVCCYQPHFGFCACLLLPAKE